MRRREKQAVRAQRRKALRQVAVLGVLCGGIGLFFWYMTVVVNPVLYELAEYECRAVTVHAMNDAIAQEMSENPARYQSLYTLTTAENGSVQTVCADAAAINQARLSLVAAVQDAMQALPQADLAIPFGSLTDLAPLDDLGPSWRLTLQPQGYVEGTVREQTQALDINRTQYTATLELTVTINMVLEGNTATAVVTNEVPLASLLLTGDTPVYFSRD